MSDTELMETSQSPPSRLVQGLKILDALVKVYCIHTEPNYSLPWQRKAQYQSTSSGFAIQGRRLITNAHSVQHHTQVRIKKHGDEKKYLAKVVAVAEECDLALLEVGEPNSGAANEEFWEGLQEVQLEQVLPRLQVRKRDKCGMNE